MNHIITPPYQSHSQVLSRSSNFEALRLLCMIMVLNLHSFSGYEHGSGIWQAIDFFRESTSICAVDCFILISGYFGIRWKFKSFFNLVFQVFFYSVLVYLVAVALGIVGWNLYDFLERFECLYNSSKSWGFVVGYVMLYFCAPLLNALSDKTNKKELLLFIFVFFIAINFISIPRSAIFTYILIYLIGRFLKKANIAAIKINFGYAYWITTIAIFLLVYLLIYKTLNIKDPGVVCTWPIGLLGYDYAAPLVILQAVFLFLFFSRLQFSSTFINWCASSCFAIFLIHMHPTIKEIGYYSFTRNLYNYPVFTHISYLLVLILIVFFGSIIIDKFRIAISNGCYWLFSWLTGVLPAKFLKMETYLPKKLCNAIKE